MVSAMPSYDNLSKPILYTTNSLQTIREGIIDYWNVNDESFSVLFERRIREIES